MKPRVGAQIVRLSPAPEGWRAQTGADTCMGTTLKDLCTRLPGKLRAELLLPSSAIVTEQLALPEAPLEDLLSMTQLQLEKLLPYAADDFVFDIEELGQSGDGVRILAVTVPIPELKSCAEPLRAAGLGPVAVGVYAVQLARNLAAKGTVLALWIEGGLPYLLLAVDGKLVWLEGLPSENTEPEAAEVSRVILGAELAGVIPGPLTRACVDAPDWVNAVRQALPDVPIEEAPLEPLEELVGSWLPPAWAQEADALTRKSRFMERLQWLAIAYAALLAGGFCWLALEKSRIGKLDQRIAELQPQVELSNARQARWRNLEPAVEPSRYLIELLYQASQNVGGADIRITEFQVNPKEFAFSAEAANVSEAIEYVGRLKKNPELSSFKLDSPNPNILPNERAQFRVSGKVESLVSKR